MDDIIAEDTWRYTDASGADRTTLIQIGRPRPAPDDPNGDWGCPVFIESSSSEPRMVFGVGPVDSLLNAMTLVQRLRDEAGEFEPRFRG